MNELMIALGRSLASLRSGKVWFYVLTPALLSLALWILLGLGGFGLLVGWLVTHPPLSLLAAWGLAWLATLLAYLGGWMAIFAGAYLTASLLAAVVILPLLLRHLSATDYADVARMGEDSFAASTVNSVLAAAGFVLGWCLTLPLWLVPGLSLILPFLLMAWYNRRTFAYDSLSAHATEVESHQLRRHHRTDLLLLGAVMALLAHVPVLGLLAPALAALAYAHYLLEALRRLRRGAVVSQADAGRLTDVAA